VRITAGGFDLLWKGEAEILRDVRLSKAPNASTQIHFDQVAPGAYLNGVPFISSSPIDRSKNFFLSYFLPMFPLDQVEHILAGTNEKIGRSGAMLDAKELFTFLELLLSMAVIKLPNRKDYWACQTLAKDGPLPRRSHHDFSPYMKQARFEFIMKNFALRKAPISNSEKSDAWFMVRQFVASFNGWRRKIVEPGSYVCVDESMVLWNGADETSRSGMPHVTIILRKPEPIGCELKTLADGESRIMLAVELQEGKEAMREKEFMETGKVGTAQTLRCAKKLIFSAEGDAWWEILHLLRSPPHLLCLKKACSSQELSKQPPQVFPTRRWTRV
jgi:hypothetical protein